MTNEVINILMDDTLVTDSATDLGTGITDGSDRGVVFKASTHELVGTLFTGLDGKLAFREVLSSPLMPLPSFTHAEGVSARRKTAAFFDSSAPDDFDQLGLREVSMVTGLELNSTLYMPIGHAPGTITSATYRDIDDSYFILNREPGQLNLYRIAPNSAVRLVVSFNDDGTGEADVTSDEDGLLAVTRRGTSSFATLVLGVNTDLS